MAQLTIQVNGRPYTVGCEDGQEAHLLEIADAHGVRNECVARQRPSLFSLGACREIAPGGGAQAVGRQILEGGPAVGR